MLREDKTANVEDSYKYPGILQANGNHEKAARKATTVKYLQKAVRSWADVTSE